MNTDDDEIQERRFDWALRETLGDERAPDVAVAVRKRFDAGEQVDGSPRPPALRRWLAAAAVLLGAFAVTAVWLTSRPTGPTDAQPIGAPAAPNPQDPTPIEVTSLAAIAELPRDTAAVELRNLGDDAVALLVKQCPDLQRLRVFASTAYWRNGDPEVAVSITDDALPLIGSLARLQTLELVGTDAVTGGSLRELERLPLLQSLALTHFDLGDPALHVLPRLQSLRHLDLTLNHGFTVEGVALIGQCPRIVRLGLASCSQLTAEDLLPLARLQRLRDLDLGSIGRSWRGFGRRVPSANDREREVALQLQAEQRGTGVTLAAIAAWPQLRKLQLAYGHRLEPEIGARLRQTSPGLRELDLGGCPQVNDVTVAELLGLRSLTTLDLSDCPAISEQCLPLLRESAALRELRLNDLAWMTLERAETLFRSGKQVVASRKDDEDFNQGMRALAAKYAGQQEPFRWETVHSLDDLAALPHDAENIAVRNLSDEACRLLARRSNLRRLQVVRSDAAPTITDASLEFLARLPALEVLELYTLQGVDGSFLARLGELQRLRELKLVGIPLAAGALAPLPRLSIDSLDLTGCRTIADADLAAIAHCQPLRRLDLGSCTQLEADSIARLGALTGLEELNLTNTGGTTDRALAALAPLTGLRKLGLGEGSFTAAGLQAVQGMRALRALDLSDNQTLATSALLQLPVGLQELRLDRCNNLDATAGALLRDRFPSLRTLGLTQGKWLDDAAFAAILELPQLESLTAVACPGVTAASFAAIRQSRSLRRLDIANCGWFTAALAQQLRRERPELTVTYRVWSTEPPAAQDPPRESTVARGLVEQLDSLDSQLGGGPGFEQLKDMFNKVRELKAECEQTGPEFESRRVELRKRIDKRCVEQLTKKAQGDAATATEGKHLLAAGELDDLLRQLLEEAKAINDAEALGPLDPLSKAAFRSSNQAAIALFTPEYQARIPARDLLAQGLGDWIVTPSESMKFNITGQGLVMTNQGEGARSAGVAYEPGLDWRDYVIDIEFRVDSGTMAFYTRVGRDDKMDSKAVPAFTAGTKNPNINVEYGKVYQGTVRVIGDQFSVAIEGIPVFEEQQGRARARKGRVGIVCQPDSSFTISRLKVRHLR